MTTAGGARPIIVILEFKEQIVAGTRTDLKTRVKIDVGAIATSGGSDVTSSSDEAAPKSAVCGPSGLTMDGTPRNYLQSTVASLILKVIGKRTRN